LSKRSSFPDQPAYVPSLIWEIRDNIGIQTKKAVRKWLNGVEAKTLFIEPSSSWENGYVESFNSKLKDELLNGKVFTTLAEAKVLIEQWRGEYNRTRPHSSGGYRLPAPEAKLSLTLT